MENKSYDTLGTVPKSSKNRSYDTLGTVPKFSKNRNKVDIPNTYT